MDQVFEPLEQTAPLAYGLASSLCAPHCRLYHGTWQFLRLLGLNVTIRADRGFFIDRFRQLARQGVRRVLVSGSADYGMLAQTLFAFRSEGVEPEIVLIDHCATPLEVNKDYARRLGANLSVVHGDVRAVTIEPVDLICTHSFFTFFPLEVRTDLTRAWYGMLSPGGWVITTNPLRPLDPTSADRKAPEQVERYRQQVLAAARAFDGELPMTPEVLAENAAVIRATHPSHGTSSLDELRAPFDAAGFKIELLDPGIDTSSHAGPFVEQGSKIHRAQVIARRPS